MMFASLCSFQVIVFLLIYKLNGANTTGKFYTTHENKQYFINEDQKYTWFDALSECLKMNMTLVNVETSLKSQEVNTLVKNTFDRIVILWVGGIMTRYPDSRHYIWIATGQPFNYTYWHGKNPDFNGNNEYCIQIGWGSNMEWNDNRCTSNYGFICEEHRQHSLIDSVKDKENNLEMELKEQEKLKQNLIMEIKEQHNLQQELQKQKELAQALKQQLKIIKEETELRKQELVNEIAQMAVKEKNNLQPELKKQQLVLGEEIQKEPEGKQQIDEKKNKYHQISFQFNQNTYLLPNAQIPLNGNT